MNKTANRRAFRRVMSYFTRRKVYHSIFWAILLLLVLARIDGGHFGVNFLVALNEVLFFAAIAYFNLYYLIPNYLSNKKLLHYGGLLMASALVLTPVKLLVSFLLFSSNEEFQSIVVDNQIYSFLSMFVFAGASTILKIIKDWLQHQREQKDLQTRTMQSELRFLKSQINPHFLFNTLNNLYALTLKKSDKAPEIVIKLSEMMRYMLYECNEKRVLLSKEVNYLRNYLDLERLRQGENAEITFEVKGEIKDQRIAPLMFIPFLENSFKHGLNHSLSKGFVYISMNLENGQMTFLIENNKPERLPTPDHRRVGGIGLVNVRRRLNLLYPGQYELDIKDSPKSYAVELRINLD